ncbi:PREDICTED: sugar transporter SWEET1 [Nicrophorus vespilloides]|uniref:Sugar transporter SWEET n=1 Tax=Nicrophorus vespilloides TaxID=110193 RepID=A0ABM1MZL2_NICVS|nr:PREDICTED: sugar transporter SWEET1 [Nicrophorus vespilloides]
MLNLDDFKDFIAVSASICTILQFLSGTLVCQNFVQKGSTGDISAFPFISGCLSTSLWLRYGFIIQERSIILVNTIGATLFFAYVLTFYFYSIKKWAVVRQFLLCMLILIAILFYSSTGNESDEKELEAVRSHIGTLCCIMTIIFFAAPFSTLMHVIKVKSSESMPFPLILTSFLVSCQWYAYGLIIKDQFVQIPNFLGSVLSAIQLSLFCLYPTKYKPLDQI